MRKLSFFVTLITISLFLFSCGKSKDEIAGELVNNFMQSLMTDNVDSAKQFADENTLKLLDKITSDKKKCGEDADTIKTPIKYEIMEKKMNDADGTVKIRIFTPYEERIEIFPVKKQDENWLITLEERHIAITRFVIFRGFYDVVIQKYEERQKKKEKERKEKEREKERKTKKTSKTKHKGHK